MPYRLQYDQHYCVTCNAYTLHVVACRYETPNTGFIAAFLCWILAAIMYPGDRGIITLAAAATILIWLIQGTISHFSAKELRCFRCATLWERKADKDAERRYREFSAQASQPRTARPIAPPRTPARS